MRSLNPAICILKGITAFTALKAKIQAKTLRAKSSDTMWLISIFLGFFIPASAVLIPEFFLQSFLPAIILLVIYFSLGKKGVEQ